MSLASNVIDYLESVAPLEQTSGDVASVLGADRKSVSSTISKLVKSGRVVRTEAGNYTVPVEESPTSTAAGETPAAEEADSAPAEEAEEALPAAGSKDFNIPAWKRRISSMLAKAERTENDHERDAYLAKAEQMMLRLGIHRAELEAQGEAKQEQIVQRVREWKGYYSIAMLPFVYDVAEGFGHLTVLQETYSATFRKSYIVGPEAQVEEFLRLIDSLHTQVLSALRRWQKENIEARRELTEMEKFIQHRSFITGFGQTVQRRLELARKGEETQASPGAALVIANRDTEVAAWVEEKYGPLKPARGGMKYGSHAARAAGREAGKSATLNQKNLDTKKAVTK